MYSLMFCTDCTYMIAPDIDQIITIYLLFNHNTQCFEMVLAPGLGKFSNNFLLGQTILTAAIRTLLKRS
jgi:hypothetical protein